MWLFNVLTAFVFFVIYRVIISQTDTTDSNWFETILWILKILVDLGFSLVFLGGMLISSLAIFLNLIPKVRSSFVLSALSFLGIPVIGLLYFMMDLVIDNVVNKFFATFILLSTTYILITLAEFIIFRKQIKTYTNE